MRVVGGFVDAANSDGAGEIHGSIRRSCGDHGECVWEGQGCLRWSRSGREESCTGAASAGGHEREQVTVWRANRCRGDETTGGRKGVGVRVEPRGGSAEGNVAGKVQVGAERRCLRWERYAARV